MDRSGEGEAQSISAEDPPTHHYAAQPVLAKVGNGQGLAFKSLIQYHLNHGSCAREACACAGRQRIFRVLP